MNSTLSSAATVLVVDDQDTLRLPICKTLSSTGFRVLDAGNGIEALALLRDVERPVDLLVTDYRMPGMTGVELARKCCSLNGELSVLYISGSNPGEDLREDLAREKRAFLAKPFRQAELLRSAKALLDMDTELAAGPSRQRSPVERLSVGRQS